MSIRSTIRKASLWALPMSSDRRMIGRTIQQLLRTPGRVPARFNNRNFGNFLRFRRRAFCCPVCGRRTTPLYDFPDLWLRREHRVGELRETLQCRQCFAPMRERSLAVALLDQFELRRSVSHQSIAALAAAGLAGVRVLETDNFSATSRLLRGDPDHIRCSYMPDRPWGEVLEPSYYNIDLERIDFPDESFDIVLTSDVMEHVRDSDAAHAEIYRVLRRGGAYIFNVPYDDDEENDVELVDTKGKDDIFLCKPQYHGDPLTGGILAYRIFGREVIVKLEALGFEVQFEHLQRPENLIIDGDVFVALRRQ